MNEKILTIGILAYNREKYIKSNLDAIISQLSDFDPENIEILISDNVSEDNTERSVGSYRDRYPQLISYYRNTSNVGFDKNVDLVVQRAKGKYVWLLGCEDIPKRGAIREILKAVSSDTYDNILVNLETFSEKTGKIDCDNLFNIDNNEICFSLDELMKKCDGPNPAISGNVVLRESWLKVVNKPLFVNGWCHVERIFDLLILPGYKKSLRISYVCFTLTRGKNEWWD
jgi:glycosyltransferase involved in cell wall biosynthesis